MTKLDKHFIEQLASDIDYIEVHAHKGKYIHTAVYKNGRKEVLRKATRPYKRAQLCLGHVCTARDLNHPGAYFRYTQSDFKYGSCFFEVVKHYDIVDKTDEIYVTTSKVKPTITKKETKPQTVGDRINELVNALEGNQFGFFILEQALVRLCKEEGTLELRVRNGNYKLIQETKGYIENEKKIDALLAQLKA